MPRAKKKKDPDNHKAPSNKPGSRCIVYSHPPCGKGQSTKMHAVLPLFFRTIMEQCEKPQPELEKRWHERNMKRRYKTNASSHKLIKEEWWR